MPDYSNGKIYKIYNTITDDIYIGATTQLLSERLREHRRASKTKTAPLYKFIRNNGVEHFYIELLENANCINKDE